MLGKSSKNPTEPAQFPLDFTSNRHMWIYITVQILKSKLHLPRALLCFPVQAWEHFQLVLEQSQTLMAYVWMYETVSHIIDTCMIYDAIIDIKNWPCCAWKFARVYYTWSPSGVGTSGIFQVSTSAWTHFT